MYGPKPTSSIEAIKATHPKHDIQSVKLQANNQNEQHVGEHGPVEHFVLE
jgi:hypothetical protein